MAILIVKQVFNHYITLHSVVAHNPTTMTWYQNPIVTRGSPMT